jgi:tetratricopeptide (TPR) repeat protein
MYVHRQRKRRSSPLRILLLCLLILAGLWLIRQQPDWARPFDPTPTPTRTAISFISQGDFAFAEGNLAAAIAAFEEAIRLEPENSVPYIRQSRLLIFAGDTSKALERAERAVVLEPNSSENLAGYCRALDWEAQYGPALDACECAIETDPNYAPGYAFLSEVYADQADWIPARTTAQHALEVDFQSMDAHHNMGYALEVQGRYREAVEFYENAITLAPNLAPFYLAAGRNYYWLGNFDQAEDRFKQAIRLDPANSNGYDRLGWTYHTNGEFARAVDALEQAIAVDSLNATAWGHLGTLYYTRQNYEEAIRILSQAIELAEQDFLGRARTVQIYTEVDSASGPQQVLILRGRLLVAAEAGTVLKARLVPVSSEPPAAGLDRPETCGELIAFGIQYQAVTLSPTENLDYTLAFSATTGTVRFDIVSGELALDLENMPQPDTLPYEARLTFWPRREESVGYFQPDASNKVSYTASFSERAQAPLEYYYELGLSYAYLIPPRCDQAIPWLLTAVERDPAYYNPAWAGLRICPTDASPPTPLPTPTPLPEADEG